jgi:tetratricopeptide (TPR) repeat protein
MPMPEFEQNDNYRQYVELLRQLHAVMASDHPDEAHADAIRDQMDGPWRGLGSAEIDRVQGLSADLYSLEIKHNRVPDAMTDEGRALRQSFQRACDLKHWDESLAALRKAASFFRLSDLSLARGRIWRGLGDTETAIIFYEHAAVLAQEAVAGKLIA